MQKYNIKFNQQTYNVLVRECLDDRATLDIDGKRYVIDRTAPVFVSMTPDMVNFPRVNALSQSAGPVPNAMDPSSLINASTMGVPEQIKESVVSPLPGSVLEISVNEGSTVETGDVVLKLEAMKMETEIQSKVSGRVHSVKVKVGDAVDQDQVLVEIV